MLSIGIVWNTCYHFRDDIVNDIEDTNVNLLGFFDAKTDNYRNFVNLLYNSEHMEQWKIDKKLEYMLMISETSIRVIFFEFDESITDYHPFKKKMVFSDLENLKVKIRNKYKELISNYTFDIVFHATDDLMELKMVYNILLQNAENFIIEKKHKHNVDSLLNLVKKL